MNDQQLGLLIDSWLKDSDSPPADVGRSTAQIETRLPQVRQQSHWWSLPSFERLSAPVAGRSPAGGSSMFSALKFVAAVVIVALSGSFLLSGILTTPQDDEVLPAVVTDESAFPTGTFESEEGGLALEFRADGTCARAGVPCAYGINGRFYSEMSFEDPSGAQVPATYYWDYDGEHLTFELYGEDKRPGRQSTYVDHAYRLIEAGAPLMPATESGFPIGQFEAVDDSTTSLSFRDNGRWRAGSPSGGASGAYAVSGDLYTELTHNSSASAKVPATYRWHWDGERLSFSLWGDDTDAWRKSFYAAHAYVRAEAPELAGKRRLLLSDPRLDVWVTVEIKENDGRYEATATIDEEPLGEGVGDTLQEAIKAALQALGEPYASDMARSVKS